MKKWQREWIGGLAILIFLVLWEIARPVGLVKVADISRPTLVLKAFVIEGKARLSMLDEKTDKKIARG